MGREGIVSRVERPSVTYPWHLDKSSRLRHCFEQLRRIVGRAVPIQRGELSLDEGAGRHLVRPAVGMSSKRPQLSRYQCEYCVLSLPERVDVVVVRANHYGSVRDGG